jgi:hypothetical protein
MSDELLLKMAQRAAQNMNLIASLIAVYMESEAKSWEAVAGDLDISDTNLARLALCRRPREEHMLVDIHDIATYIDIDNKSLLQFVRKVGALEVFSDSTAEDWSLSAARDQSDDDEE